MRISQAQLKSIAGGRPDASNVKSVVVALEKYGAAAGLDKPHRLAHFLAQVAHESGGFKDDREIWGPTPAQKRYEGRKDLGNTVRGDGKKFAGRGPIQLTGRGNVVKFKAWCDVHGHGAPDFVADPNLINTDPWEGLSAIWFWDLGNQTGKSLNNRADNNDIEMVSRTINGGLNGFDDRLRYYTRAALVLLGYGPDEVKPFQEDTKILADGIPGPQTRSTLHLALIDTTPDMEEIETKAAPVTNDVVVDVKAPGKGLADTATGGGLATAGLGGILQTLQEQLTPFSAAGKWIGTLVIVLIVAGAVLTIGGLVYRWWAMRKKATVVAALNAPVVTVKP